MPNNLKKHDGQFEPVEGQKDSTGDLSYRSMSVRLSSDGKPATLDSKARSVDVIVATEQLAEVFDYERWEVINEVLLMSGAEVPGNRQVPLLDTHYRGDTSSVLGSVRELGPVNGDLIGRAFFSEVNEAQSPFKKVSEGHLTDFSVGYRVQKSEWIPEGESAMIDGRNFDGPVKVVSSWKIKEVSIVPIGADEQAKVRESARSESTKKQTGVEKTMNKEKEILQKERQRIEEITAACRKYEMLDDLEDFISDGATIGEVRKRALAAMQERLTEAGKIGYRGPVTIIADQTDKRIDATIDGQMLRAGFDLEKPAPGSNEYRVMNFADIASECLQAQGVRTRGVSKSRLIAKALQTRAAYTGDFPNILANTANKVLRTAYQQAPSTFELWCNLTDGADFKEMSRNQLSEAGDLDEIPEHGEYRYGTFGESKEVFSITKYGKLFAITREALINDDLGAFFRVPQQHAMAAKRKVNDAAYAVLTGNSAMGDGVALFHADHSNYVPDGSGAAPGEATLNAGRLSMRTQTGLNGATLNIAPQFLIVPAALETTADKLLNSLGDLADNKSSGVINPFYKKLEPVVEASLDQTDAATWYLAADPRQIDTVEICFLGGRREPYLESKQGWNVDGVEYKVRIEFGAKAIDWRGLYCNDGD
jgi:hypothetical protein